MTRKLAAVPTSAPETPKPEAPAIPKTCWFEDSKGYLRELPSDTPARSTSASTTPPPGKMFPLHEAEHFQDIQVHDHSWIDGMRTNDPVEVTLQVRVRVMPHVSPREVAQKLRTAIRTSSESTDGLLSAIVVEPEEKK